MNVLVGEKVSIVSPKPQTTRDCILGILTAEDYQIVFEDTPGIYKADNALNAAMQKTAERTAKDVDAVLLVVDAHAGLREGDKALAEKFARKGAPSSWRSARSTYPPKKPSSPPSARFLPSRRKSCRSPRGKGTNPERTRQGALVRSAGRGGAV